VKARLKDAPLPVRATPTEPDLLRAARRRFLKGERASVEELAAELGISRATAYRWARNADELAGRVVAAIVEDTFELTRREAKGKGADRIVDAMARGMRYIAKSAPYRAFVARDPERALRIVASKDGPVQRRTIALNEGLLKEEIARGNLHLTVDPHTMAYALVRLVESFLYADTIVGEQPDLEKAVEIMRLMLRQG